MKSILSEVNEQRAAAKVRGWPSAERMRKFDDWAEMAELGLIVEFCNPGTHYVRGERGELHLEENYQDWCLLPLCNDEPG
jgi:hypothetical protein